MLKWAQLLNSKWITHSMIHCSYCLIDICRRSSFYLEDTWYTSQTFIKGNQAETKKTCDIQNTSRSFCLMCHNLNLISQATQSGCIKWCISSKITYILLSSHKSKIVMVCKNHKYSFLLKRSERRTALTNSI